MPCTGRLCEAESKRRLGPNPYGVNNWLATRGICVTYETVRQWGKKFGKAFADQIRQRAPARGDKWHMDGVSRTYSLGWGVELYER